ncbi:MAG: site-specific DNA-methyltransferase, partial [Candidatus Omnitrophica bacterium]|nr:site-specific DNA-methyltransferase [Candidatus Omnitrophota bacterium]
TDDYFVTEHEYIVVYKKNDTFVWKDEEITNAETSFNKEDENGKFKAVKLSKWGTGARKEDRPTMHFPIKNLDGKNVLPVAPDGNPGRWRIGKARMNHLFENDLVHWEVKNGNCIPYEKIYYDENDVKVIKDRSILFDETTTADGTNALTSLFNIKDIFDNPKPYQLIQFFLKNNTIGNDIVADFFAGSGTTAHAVIEQNKQDNQNRKFMVIQIPELTKENSASQKAGYNKISDITIERNKRVIRKIEKEEAEKQLSLLVTDKKPFKTGFKVYKLAKSNFPRIDFAPDPAKTEEENLALLNKYIDEKETMYLAMIDEKNIFDEVLLKNGFMLNYSKEKADGFSKNKVFQIKDDFKECLICMDMNLSKETLKELEQYKEKIFICLERALDTTMKWNLKHLLGDKLIAF